ncbi:MAG: hypothetical protein P4L82_11875 [Ancalomicrobiaceae bacterium]|nr:hypothetical protein [Ancalomicrobiaceae bacterium]
MAETIAPGTPTVEVKLGGASYRVPHLTLGQQRRMMLLTQRHAAAPPIASPDGMAAPDELDDTLGYGLSVAVVLFERADPTIGDIEELACTFEELRAASEAIQAFSGLRPAASNSEDGTPGKKSAKPRS